MDLKHMAFFLAPSDSDWFQHRGMNDQINHNSIWFNDFIIFLIEFLKSNSNSKTREMVFFFDHDRLLKSESRAWIELKIIFYEIIICMFSKFWYYFNQIDRQKPSEKKNWTCENFFRCIDFFFSFLFCLFQVTWLLFDDIFRDFWLVDSIQWGDERIVSQNKCKTSVGCNCSIKVYFICIIVVVIKSNWLIPCIESRYWETNVEKQWFDTGTIVTELTPCWVGANTVG